MAGNNIRISTDKVLEIAAKIEQLNGQLEETLMQSKASVDGLGNIWESEAARETISAYDSFAAKYFENYKEIILTYVTFLRQNVAGDYAQTETANVSLAEAFR